MLVSPTQSEVIAMGVVPAVVVGFFLFLRFYARRGRVSFGIDDMLITLAYVRAFLLGWRIWWLTVHLGRSDGH